ncbi:MAG: carbon starvation protein A [Kiritimatiellae bacterium]|nr:carbon starvation protein A [Kiritimatiellia bacterium]
MQVILLMLVTFFGYIVAYHTYGRFLAKRIFKLSEDKPTPSVEKEDGIDFVPTRKGIIFGHHYTSIAGTGPIVGPAIGIIWGWIPALLWIFVGSIIMGAVHDFGALVVSMRNEGKSIAECSAKYISPRVHYIFFSIIFLLLMIVIAIFGIVIAAIFSMYPQSIFPVWTQIPIAIALGWSIYKRHWNVTLLTAGAVAIMYLTIWAGASCDTLSFKMPSMCGLPPTGVWVVILLVYAFIASSLPVTTLLQPRDYINAWQLFVAMGLLITGIIVSGLSGKLSIVAPAFAPAPPGAPPMIPFLFVTIACGAISGFHALVGSGTTSKQIAKETDAQFVGYGSMLMEGALATLIIIAVAAGIGMAYEHDGTILTGTDAWNEHYKSWQAAKGLGSKLSAVVVGSANMMSSIGLPAQLGIVIMGVFIASFAGTTLDTSTRIQRYVVAELFSKIRLRFMTNRFAATAFAVFTAAALAFMITPPGKSLGTGALILWPLFGAGNQLLACLALLVTTNYLARKSFLKSLVSGIPCIFMAVITVWSVAINEQTFIREKNWTLAVINGLLALLAASMLIEGIIALLGNKRSPNEKRL